MTEGKPVYWRFDPDLMDDLIDAGVLPACQVDPMLNGKLLLAWLDVVGPCELADRVVAALEGPQVTLH